MLDQALVASAQGSDADGAVAVARGFSLGGRRVEGQPHGAPVGGSRLREERAHQAVHRPGAGVDGAGDVLAVAAVGGQAHEDAVQLPGAGGNGAGGDGAVLEHPGSFVGAHRGQRGADAAAPGDDRRPHQPGGAVVRQLPGAPGLVQRRGQVRLHVVLEQVHRAMKGDQLVEPAPVVEPDRFRSVLDELLTHQIGLAVGQGTHLDAHPAG